MRNFLADIHRHDIEAAIRVAAGVGLPLLALDAIGRLDLAVYAAFGGLAMLYGHSEPAKKRVVSQAVAGTALVVTMAVALAWSASHAPLAVLAVLLVLTVIAAVTLDDEDGRDQKGAAAFGNQARRELLLCKESRSQRGDHD